MRAVSLLLVAASFTVGAGGVPPDGLLAPLTAAVDDAEAHVAALARHAASASPPTLAMPTDDEQGAVSALVDANAALDHIMHGPTAVLPRETDLAVLAALDRAHDALGSYVQARMHGNRNLMRASAAEAAVALAQADTILGAERPH